MAAIPLSFNLFARRAAALALPVMAVMLFSAAPAFAQTNALALDEMMAKFVKNIAGPFMQITYVGAYVFGIYLLMKGLFKCIKYSDEGSKGQQKFSGIWGTLVFGALLIALPSSMNTVAGTLYGGNMENYGSDAPPSTSALSYATMSADIQQKIDRTYWTIMTFIQMIGLVSFARGISILRSVTDGNTQVTSMAGLTHIIAGAIGWNLGQFVQVIYHTIGFTV